MSECHAVYVRNFGASLARDIKYEFQIGEDSFTNAEQFFQEFAKKFVSHYALDYGTTFEDANQGWIGRYFSPALYPNHTERILWLKGAEDGMHFSQNEEDKRQVFDAFHDLLEQTDIRVIYSSPHKRRFSRSLEESRAGIPHGGEL